MARTAAALIIGSEILSGKTRDSNAHFLARELYDVGVALRRIEVVPDAIDDIVAAVRDLYPRHEVVFTSGGVGPTHDDITLEAIAKALDRPLLRNAELARLIARYHDVDKSPLALRMADLPEGAELVHAAELRVPVVKVENLYVLPGVPSIFERKLHAIRELFREQPYHLRQVFVSEGEAEIAATLYALVERFPGLSLGSYPEIGNPDHQVKLTLESKDKALVEEALAVLLAQLPEGAVRRYE